MWIVWRPDYPDPSQSIPAIHVDDPTKDREASGRLAVILVAIKHRSMSLDQLLTIDAYNLPAKTSANIEGNIVRSMGDGGKRVPVTIEA